VMDINVVCHIHSDWSYDAKTPLRQLAESFAKRNNTVVMMTEHDRGFSEKRYEEYRCACAEASSNEILVLPGMEYSDAENRVHVLTWGVPFLGEGLPTGEMLQAVKRHNGIAVLAHPTRRNAWQEIKPDWLECLTGIEVWNRKYDGWAPSATAPGLLGLGKFIPFVGLDYHTERQMFSLQMVLGLRGPCTEESVLDAVRRGRCSARAFGLPLDHTLLRTSMPGMKAAERGRRKLSSFVKKHTVAHR